MRYKHDMAGPKTFEEWVATYEERDDSRFLLSPGERVVFDPMRGFFTWAFDPGAREILIPKMCGDGRHWRPLIHKMYRAAKPLGVKGVLCCTKRNPRVYMRVLGGTLRKMVHTYDFATGRDTVLWHIFITGDDTKEANKT